MIVLLGDALEAFVKIGFLALTFWAILSHWEILSRLKMFVMIIFRLNNVSTGLLNLFSHLVTVIRIFFLNLFIRPEYGELKFALDTCTICNLKFIHVIV